MSSSIALPRTTGTSYLPVLTYLASCFFAFLAGNMFNYVMVIYCRHISNSDGFTGLVNLAAYAMPLCLSLYAGSIIDRRSRKWLLFAFQSLWMLTAALLCVAIWQRQPEPVSQGVVLGVSLVNGVAFAFLMPARFAFAADVSPPAALARSTIVVNVLLIAGFGLAPLLVGVLKQHHEWHEVFAVIVALFGLSNVLLLATPGRSRPRAERGQLSVVEGLRRLRQEKLLLQLLWMTAIAFLPLGPIQILMPQFARDALGSTEEQRGALMGLLGLGLLLGGVIALIASRSKRRGILILGAQLATAAAIFALSSASAFAIAGTLLVVTGISGGMAGSLIPAAIQTSVESEVRGRVLSFYSLISLIMPALAGAVFGASADWLGIAFALKLSALVLVTLALLALSTFDRLRAYG